MATFFTFLPSFLFIPCGAPLVEATHGDLKFTAPLTGITSAVVGVVVNLAVFFAWHVLWPAGTGAAPFAGGFQWFAAVVSVTAFVALVRFKRDVLEVIGASRGSGSATPSLPDDRRLPARRTRGPGRQGDVADVREGAPPGKHGQDLLHHALCGRAKGRELAAVGPATSPINQRLKGIFVRVVSAVAGAARPGDCLVAFGGPLRHPWTVNSSRRPDTALRVSNETTVW